MRKHSRSEVRTDYEKHRHSNSRRESKTFLNTGKENIASQRCTRSRFSLCFKYGSNLYAQIQSHSGFLDFCWCSRILGLIHSHTRLFTPLHIQPPRRFERSAPLQEIVCIEHHLDGEAAGLSGGSRYFKKTTLRRLAKPRTGRADSGDEALKQILHVYYTCELTRTQAPKRTITCVPSRCLRPILDTLRGTRGRGGAPRGWPVEMNLIRRL